MKEYLDEYVNKTQFSEDYFNIINKDLEYVKKDINSIKSIAAHKEDLDAKYQSTNKLFREFEASINNLQNSLTTISNYTEKYIPFHFQKAIHDAFLFITRDEAHQKLISKYFPRVYRGIHHKILNTDGKPSIESDITELNALLKETRYENIGIPITTQRFTMKKSNINVGEEELEANESKEIKVIAREGNESDIIIKQVNYRFNLLKEQIEKKAKEQKEYTDSKNEEVQAYLQSANTELQGFVKKIRLERNESVNI